MQPTFYFYDYETFGVDPAYDRPVQFAGIRTDTEFNIIEQPLILYCKPTCDYLPDPESILITGITPQEAHQKGVCEAEFTKQINSVFNEPNSCILGYNNVRFDDEVTRYLFYRNFYNSYDYSWRNGNSRWDLIDVVRACYALRPEGICWPNNDQNLPSFRLEDLTAANNISHEHAHDAMSDVYATIAMAKLIKSKQPKLFNYLFKLRHKEQLLKLIDLLNMTPLIHVSGMIRRNQGHATWITPLANHPERSNSIIVCDLMGDMQPLIAYSVEKLIDRLYTNTETLLTNNLSPIPLKLIHLNKCPVIAPIKVLNPVATQRLNIDPQKCLSNLQFLKKHQVAIRNKVNELFTLTTAHKEENSDVDVDTQLYAGFFDSYDEKLRQIVRSTTPELLKNLTLNFHDARLKTLYLRYKARNYPHILTKPEQEYWNNYQNIKFSENKISAYLHDLEKKFLVYQNSPTKLGLLKATYDYCQFILAPKVT